MTEPAEARRRLQALLATADIHETPYEQGVLQWQHWSGSAGGTPLVLLHGGFGSWNHWFANIESLRGERDLWTVDLPGLGASGPIGRGTTTGDLAAALHAGLRQVLGKRDYQLAGFSFGAMVGAQLAADSNCHRFTAIGAAGCGDMHVQVSLQPPPSVDTPWVDAAPIHRANLRALMFSGAAAIDEMAVYLHATNLARHRFNSRALSRSNDFLDALPAVAGKLVAVWGSEDATAGGAEAIEARREKMHALKPGLEFHRLDGVGHWAMYEAPAAIDGLLLR